MKRTLVSLIVLLVVLASSGCNDALTPNFSLVSNDSTYNAEDVTIAVDAAGWKHVAWSECSAPSHCRIVYTKFLFTKPTSFTYLVPYDPVNFSYQDPDIAVTASGVAYLVFRKKELLDSSYVDCYNVPSVDTSCYISNISPTPESYGRPRVAARGEVVYIVRESREGLGTALTYEQLKPVFDQSKGKISGMWPDHINTDADLAISGDGTLHVVWRNTTNPNTVYYNDNYGITGVMTHLLYFSGGDYIAPKIACDSRPDDTGRCFIAIGDKALTAAPYTITMRYIRVNNYVDVEYSVLVDLSSSTNWILRGNLALAAAGMNTSTDKSTAYLAFSATNTQSPTNSQVYNVVWSGDLDAPTPNLLSDPAATDYKSSPLITPITGEVLGSPFTSGVTAWRNGYAMPGGFYDAYVWDSHNEVRKVFTSFHSPVSTGLSGFDLAGNGNMGGGVWIDEQNARNTRKVPWVSMNWIPTFLPVVVR